MNPITEAAIRQRSSAQTFARGKEYYRSGAVVSLIKRGARIEAEVEGSEAEPYEVIVTFKEKGDAEAECDCAFEGQGWCKHVVAVLLYYLQEPREAEELPTLESMLAPFDRDALEMLLLDLARRKPEWAEEIELGIAILKPQLAQRQALSNAEGKPVPAFAPSDLSVIRRQVRTLLKSVSSGGEYEEWDDDYGYQLEELESGIAPLLETAEAFAHAGDVPAALATLEAITDSLLDEWDRVADIIGDTNDLFNNIGGVWAETILTGELSSKGRQDWIAKLKKWQRKGKYNGAETGLATAVEAARTGWDFPPLVRVLQGEITDKGAWGEEEVPDCADELAVARLNVLERQGRLQEAAYFAEAEGEEERYIALLVRLGRAKEAVEVAMKALTHSGTALDFAKVLQDAGEAELALRTAEHGLNLLPPVYSLAIWLRDTALAAGDKERAVLAARAAIGESPRLPDYTLLKELAGERWPEMCDEILSKLREPSQFGSGNTVDIFLHEGLMQDALNAVRNSYQYDLIARVVEAATPTLPLQVIPICIAQAATIMDGGKADRYHYAAQWVERARDAYRAAGQEANWQDFKEALLETHKRKYKLIPMLRDL